MEVLDEQLWARFQALHLQIKDYVHNAVEEVAHHKSYEGRMTVSFGFPSCFGESSYVSIHLWSYLLGGEFEWSAPTFEEALVKAEKDIYRRI